jgi:hypothetical protein
MARWGRRRAAWRRRVVVVFNESDRAVFEAFEEARQRSRLRWSDLIKAFARRGLARSAP